MASATETPPRLEVRLSFDRPSHSFSQATPPDLTLSVTSKASTPLTLYTWNSPLSPKDALTNKGITIAEAESGELVQTASLMVQRAPLKRTKGTSDEKYFVTIYPSQTIELSTGFGRGGGTVRPQPKSIVERGLELDENGNPRNIRRSKSATGVDGLEPGKKYTIGLNLDALKQTWWAPVDREEILVPDSGEGSYVQDYEWNKTPLDWYVSEAVLLVDE